MTLKNARIAVTLEDSQLAYNLSQVLLKNGAIVYSKGQIQRYWNSGKALEIDAEISDNKLIEKVADTLPLYML